MALNQTQKNLLLASLLHDVGKYYNFKPNSDHSQNSAQLLEKVIKDRSINLSEIERKLGIDLNRIQDLVKNHHVKSDFLLKILQEADKLTAMEREEKYEIGRRQRVSTPILSIFSTIEPSRSSILSLQKKKRYLVGKRVSDLIKDIEDFEKRTDTISSLVIKENEAETEINKYYNNEKWEEMEKLIIEIFKNSRNFDVLISNIDLLLFDFLKLVPSDVNEEEVFIPLYDHLKLCACTSLILSKMIKESFTDTQATSIQEPNLVTREITAISVDIGNIQGFISKSYNYEEARKGLTKRIRGRSYFISLITELIAEYIVEKLGLTHLNILRSSAGSILIISSKISEEVKREIKRELEEFIVDEMKGDLTISITFVDFDISSLFARAKSSGQNDRIFRDLLKEISTRIESQKAKRLSSVIDKISKFNEEKIGKNLCKICGNHIKDNKEACDLCEFLKEFGGNIVKEKLILVIKNPKKEPYEILSNSYESRIEENKHNEEKRYLELKIGKNKYVISVVEWDKLLKIVKENEDFYLFVSLNFLSDILNKKEVLGATKIRLFIEYSYVPLDENDNILPIEAEESMTQNSKRRALLSDVEIELNGKKEIVDFTKLCVLYFDLDNAGKIFGGGREKYEVLHVESNNPLRLGIETFEIKEMTPSKWVTLSFFTHFFFSVIANRLAKKWNVYVIFSGGDDIKAFGSPYELLNFYFDFVKEFRYYFEEKLTFSGGFILVDKNNPLFNSIRSVEELESVAKKFKINDKEIKGCVSFINREYVFPIYTSEYIKEVFNKLFEVIKIDKESGKISSTSLYNIFKIASQHIQTKGIRSGEKIFVGYSRIEYILKRNWDMNDDGWKTFLEEYIKKDVASIDKVNFNAIKFFVPTFSIFYSTISKLRR